MRAVAPGARAGDDARAGGRPSGRPFLRSFFAKIPKPAGGLDKWTGGRLSCPPSIILVLAKQGKEGVWSPGQAGGHPSA